MEISESPSEIEWQLDHDGSFTMFSLIGWTIYRGEDECVIEDQNPAPDTVFNCPQTIAVDVYYVCPDESDGWARFMLHLIDVTPPEIEVVLVANQDERKSFGGARYFVDPVVVVPEIVVIDACDPEPVIDELVLNGEPYEVAQPIDESRIHSLLVTASDEWGNSRQENVLFHIRSRESFTAGAVVESTQCFYDHDGKVEAMQATVLVASNENDFPHEEIYPAGLRIILWDSHGIPRWPIANTASIVIEEEPCYFEVWFDADFSQAPLSECPASIDVLGVGLIDGVIAYEWGARTPNVPDPDPVQALLEIVEREEPCDFEPIPIPDPPPCEVREELIIPPPTVCVHAPAPTPLPCSTSAMTTVSAGATFVAGNSLVNVRTIEWGTCGRDTFCEASSGGLAWIELVGGCCDCEITISAHAGVRAHAKVWGTLGWAAAITASGEISFITSCGAAAHSAFVAATHNNPGPNTDPVPPAPTFVTLDCVDQSCFGYLMVGTDAIINGMASVTLDATMPLWPPAGNSNMRASVRTAGFSMSLSASSDDCPDDDGDDDGPIVGEEEDD